MADAHPVVYADATALIGLARVDQLLLLRLLRNPIRVTAHVWEEVSGDPDKPGVIALRHALEIGILVVVDEGSASVFPHLDAGESTVLTAAAAVHAAVLVDERRARRTIAEIPELRRGIAHVTGIVGLILLAKDRKVIPEVRPILDDLGREGFRLSETLYRHALRLAGEEELSL